MGRRGGVVAAWSRPDIYVSFSEIKKKRHALHEKYDIYPPETIYSQTD